MLRVVELAYDPPADADTPKAPKKCGCGRSATGFCTGLHALSKEEWAASEQNPKRGEPVAGGSWAVSP